MAAPAGWVHEPVEPGPMAAKLVLRLPRAEGDDENGQVRITHYPNMRGMDEANINRWIGQVKRPDGTSYSKEEAGVTVTEMGNARLTMLDLSGQVQATMRGEPKPNHRMIAAIVDHPRGPHFVVASGPAATVEEWEDEILAFLKSAKAQ